MLNQQRDFCLTLRQVSFHNLLAPREPAAGYKNKSSPIETVKTSIDVSQLILKLSRENIEICYRLT
jgi:hypothetical protein